MFDRLEECFKEKLVNNFLSSKVLVNILVKFKVFYINFFFGL